ncbi:hypothetical protein CN566_28350 [Bacillus wiedmannii]|uniref:hypothetical protein n=1 Tax=Bacillus wiedmannii TaxID=1890302 RepID=UPI000BF503D4|nr:hypothetical protein [Bacillus wiedmannii]PEP21716.1 hypothetical protein CN566_28350 [Bacillus wiedmannii]
MKEMLEMMEKGPIEIGANDKNGTPLKQFDFVIGELGDWELGDWNIGGIIFSVIENEFVAHFMDCWTTKDNLDKVEKLDDVIAKEVFGWEKIREYWGRDGQPMKDMLISDFHAVNYSALVLEELGKKHEVSVTNSDGEWGGDWIVEVDEQKYFGERLGVAICNAAVNTVRKEGKNNEN